MSRQSLLRALACVAFALAAGSAFAQQKFYDGNWMVRGIAAAEKVADSRPTDSIEFGDAMSLLGFTQGLLSAHRRNNRMFTLMYSTAGGNARALESLRPSMKLVPLLLVPDEVTPLQAIAIAKKYLADNPQRLHESAEPIMLDALKAAYPPAR